MIQPTGYFVGFTIAMVSTWYKQLNNPQMEAIVEKIDLPRTGTWEQSATRGVRGGSKRLTQPTGPLWAPYKAHLVGRGRARASAACPATLVSLPDWTEAVPSRRDSSTGWEGGFESHPPSAHWGRPVPGGWSSHEGSAASATGELPGGLCSVVPGVSLVVGARGAKGSLPA